MDDWIPVQGFDVYSLNSLGQVRNEHTGRIIRPKVNQYDNAFVTLHRNSHRFQRGLALLVANHFLPRQNEVFDTPINLDGDRDNCWVGNLAWRPRWFARKYHQQFKEVFWSTIEVPVRDLATKTLYPDSFTAAVSHGLLDMDLVESIANRTYTWPTYQEFDIA